jgi:hypothetical protein
LAEIDYRFNRRFNLKPLPQRLLIAGLACPAFPGALAALCGALLLIKTLIDLRFAKNIGLAADVHQWRRPEQSVSSVGFFI